MTIVKILLLSLVLTSALLCVGCDSHDPEATLELVPLAQGNRWSYQLSYAGIIDSFTVEVTRSLDVRHEGRTYHAFGQNFRPNTLSEFTSHAWLYANGRDGLYSMGGVANTDTFSVRFLHRKFPGRVGEKWTTRRFVFREDSSGEFEIFDALWVSLIAVDEQLETPLGIFSCYVYKYTYQPADDVASLWDIYEYYSPGIGLVGEITKHHPDPSTPESYIIQQVLLYDHSLQ